jgi:hypothetical protein
MGMDVYGKKPTTEEGKYFCNNAWSWRPLASYACEVAPDITSKCRYWQSNDGDGLNAHDAGKLADRLQQEIDSGRTASYARLRQSEIEMMPNEPCFLCEGTGTRKPVPACGAGDPKTDGIICNGCKGNGHVRSWDHAYRIDVESVQNFVAFLRGCGGFEIW